jgi:hypothetical protein
VSEKDSGVYPLRVRALVLVTKREGQWYVDTDDLRKQVSLELRKQGLEVKEEELRNA